MRKVNAIYFSGVQDVEPVSALWWPAFHFTVSIWQRLVSGCLTTVGKIITKTMAVTCCLLEGMVWFAAKHYKIVLIRDVSVHAHIV
jgi:hypothetical protein